MGGQRLVPVDARSATRVRRALRACQRFGKPRHLVSDRAPPLRAKLLVRHLARHAIRWRHGALAQWQFVAPIDRWEKTIRGEYLGPWMLLYSIPRLQASLDRFVEYYARCRPNQALGGRTPAEVYYGRAPKRAVDPRTVVGLRRGAFRNDPELPVYRLVRGRRANAQSERSLPRSPCIHRAGGAIAEAAARVRTSAVLTCLLVISATSCPSNSSSSTTQPASSWPAPAHDSPSHAVGKGNESKDEAGGCHGAIQTAHSGRTPTSAASPARY